MTDLIKDIGTVLKPPPEGGPTADYRWRQTVAYAIVGAYATILAMALAIWGFLGAWGFPGFALASALFKFFVSLYGW